MRVQHAVAMFVRDCRAVIVIVIGVTVLVRVDNPVEVPMKVGVVAGVIG